jgi:hypothetical protein
MVQSAYVAGDRRLAAAAGRPREAEDREVDQWRRGDQLQLAPTAAHLGPIRSHPGHEVQGL